MRLNRQRPPARIETAALAAGMTAALTRCLDIVRAECVVGTGYPYAIETADALAVIERCRTDSDSMPCSSVRGRRSRFDFRQTRKALSKTQRR